MILWLPVIVRPARVGPAYIDPTRSARRQKAVSLPDGRYLGRGLRFHDGVPHGHLADAVHLLVPARPGRVLCRRQRHLVGVAASARDEKKRGRAAPPVSLGGRACPPRRRRARSVARSCARSPWGEAWEERGPEGTPSGTPPRYTRLSPRSLAPSSDQDKPPPGATALRPRFRSAKRWCPCSGGRSARPPTRFRSPRGTSNSGGSSFRGCYRLPYGKVPA